MKNHRLVLVCLISAISLGANAQIAANPNRQAISSNAEAAPVALVYIASTPKGGSANEIVAYSAATNGKLTPIAGSPFPENVMSLAANAKYLVAVNANGFDIDSYKIESDGALHYEASKNAAKSDDCNTLGALFFDRSGRSLYDMETNGSGCANNTYESFNVAASNGNVETVGDSGANAWLQLPASFIGNDVYAYTASCIRDMYWGIYGFKRSSNGDLRAININGAPPTPPNGYFYCPALTATDGSNHVAMTMQPVNQNTFLPDRPAQLASYTADDAGNLSTTNTAGKMPETEAGLVNDLKMSPSGELLAVAGSSGLQVFHFNGEKAITRETGLLTKDAIVACFWDKSNHLYAISTASGKLFAFTVTTEKAGEAPGSPYDVSSPQDLVAEPIP
ncbi:MAG: hypothetical protein ABSF17_11135 [Terracidiphilus sp.]|jgi:hypothetical protein